METLEKILQDIGFTDNQAKIYLAFLQLGEANYTELAKITGLKRTSLYSMVKDLINNGIILYSVDRKKFFAIPPEKLFVKSQEDILALHRAIPQFNSLTKASKQVTKVKFYPSVKGIKECYIDTEDFPQRGEFRYVISELKLWVDFWKKDRKDFLAKYLEKVKEARHKTLVLSSGKKVDPFKNKFIKELNMHLKYLPANYNHEFDMEVRPKAIIISQLKGNNPYAVKIISYQLAQALKVFFEFTWNLYQ